MRRFSITVMLGLVGVHAIAQQPRRESERPTRLTVEQARSLATADPRQAQHSLKSLAHIDAAVAEALAGHAGPMIALDGLTALEPDAARGLARFKEKSLFLNGLTTLSAETAAALAMFTGADSTSAASTRSPSMPRGPWRPSGARGSTSTA